MADRPIIANLDFDTVKQDIVDHFKSRDEFKDYEFTGSSLNLLMDILSYNTHYYSLASNFLLNESFLDSALLRKNVVSLAKRLNYTPRSITSAFSVIQIRVVKQTSNDNIVVIPAGTAFTSAAGNSTITFHTTKDNVAQFAPNDVVGTSKTIEVIAYEGSYRTQSFKIDKNYTDFARFDLGQNNIDVSTLAVSVNAIRYQKVTPEEETLFQISGTSSVYFIEESRTGNPQLIFGNGIAGKALQEGDQVYASYLVSSGEEGNGVSNFTVSVPGRSDVTIVSASVSQGGAARESIQSIKDNAPKWFQAQYRAVTANDYEVILKNKFADIQAINVYGGEDVGYPGSVFVCIKPKSSNALTNATKEVLKSEIISASNVVTVRPKFVDPRVFKLVLETVVVYDKSRLASNRQTLESLVSTLFEYVNGNYIGDFLSSFRESNLSYEIKNLDPSVVSSNTRVAIKAEVNIQNNKFTNYSYSFRNRLYHPTDGFLSNKGGILSSTFFYRTGRTNPSGFDEDGYGNIRLYDYIDNTKVYVNNKAGSINYTTGEIQFLYDFDFANAGSFEITVIPDSVDVIADNDMILEIDLTQSSVTAVDIKEIDVLKSVNLTRSF